MKVLVTGAAGFVGSAIVRRLLSDGHEVTGIDALTDSYDVALKQRNLETLTDPSFSFVRADLLDVELGPLLQDVELVFHEAGQPGVRSSWGAEFPIYSRANVDATQRLLEAARGATALRRFVYASSSSIYGDATRYPVTELDLPRPVSPYGVTKLAGEHLTRLYATVFGVPTVALRYFTVYGPGQRPDMAFTIFAKAALAGTPLRVHGDGTQIRDFTYVEDVVEANLLVALGEVEAGSVFNVSGGTSATVRDAIAIIGAAVGHSVSVEYGPKVPGDVFRTGGSSEALRAATGWSPRVSLEEGLTRQVSWADHLVSQG